MIRINLLATEKRAKKKAVALGAPQGILVVCVLILVASVAAVGWRYISLTRESSQLDAEITAAEQEVQRLQSLIQQVQQFEQRKAQLQERVVLIEQLRQSQTGPVHMFDQISRALPQMLWLSNLKQKDNEITIEGRTTNQTAVTDFVNNLQATGYFQRQIDIVESRTEAMTQPPGELVRFILRATFQPPGTSPATPAAAAAGAKTGG